MDVMLAGLAFRDTVRRYCVQEENSYGAGKGSVCNAHDKDTHFISGISFM